jgi:hypothetical protein
MTNKFRFMCDVCASWGACEAKCISPTRVQWCSQVKFRFTTIFLQLLFRRVVSRQIRMEDSKTTERELHFWCAQSASTASVHTRHKSVHIRADPKSDSTGVEIQFSSFYFCFRPQLNWIISSVHKPLACVCGSSLSYLTLLLLFAAPFGRTHR